MDSAPLVIGYHFTHETMVQNGFADVASTIHESLVVGEKGMTYLYQKLRIFAHPWGMAIFTACFSGGT